MEQLFLRFWYSQKKRNSDAGFNKLLSGTERTLLGYKLKDFQIEEEFGMEDYFVAIPSENPSDAIHGIALL
jgi:hypothetical protein